MWKVKFTVPESPTTKFVEGSLVVDSVKNENDEVVKVFQD